ncbi:hypothetical protein HMN09_01268400 [Mycena chlorophos]|uniref:F-box domain-containing protein n=1 Tax=Mycena chlorophos TaxID=658473 RepID=A0A8H6S0Y1_MYCCL|nr:hypothetical protein HMN09_01268400 [Mycena chlorophos]
MLTQLVVEIIHQICDHLSFGDTCRFLSEATRSKNIWIRRIEVLLREGVALPPYLPDYRLLDSAHLEALIGRLSVVADKWRRGNLAPSRVSWIGLPQPITWLRLIDGRWLFVASSNQDVSKLACYDTFWIYGGYTTPVAEAYLSGAVETAQVEIQPEGIILALGLDGEQSNLLVVTVRRDSEGQLGFYQLGRIKGSSHVLVLAGSTLGCAVHDGDNVPHLVNWKDGTVRDIPPPPGGLDTPERRSVPHLMAIHNGALFIVRSVGIEVYDCPAVLECPITFSRQISTSSIWEAKLVTSPTPQFVLLTRTGIETILLDRLTGLESASLITVIRRPNCECCAPYHTCDGLYHNVPWYELVVGPAGRQCLWVSIYGGDPPVDPYFVSMTLPRDGRPAGTPISWDAQSAGYAALWGLPCLDFDDALGIVVMGNCFGELAVYDCDDAWHRCIGWAPDAGWPVEPLAKKLPKEALPLDVRPQPRLGMSKAEIVQSTAHWYQDFLDVDDRAPLDWLDYSRVYSWQGLPCDYAWLIKHAFGFPGRLTPLYFTEDEDSNDAVLFRIGKRYLEFVRGDDSHFLAWPAVEDLNVQFPRRLAARQTTTRRTAITARQAYMRGLSHELNVRKPSLNRWEALRDRGGYRHWQDLSRLWHLPLLLFE